MRDAERYLQVRGKSWFYVRRVPADVAGLVGRSMVRTTLKTKSLEIAQLRRDALEEADDVYWASLRAGAVSGENAYRAAQRRALGYGLTYRTAPQLAETATLDDLLTRIDMLERGGMVGPAVEAVLGGVEKPSPTISQVLDIYIDKINAELVKYKSENQMRNWRKVKARAISNFKALCGDKPANEITREDALKFHAWWRDRIIKDGLSPNSGNRDVGNVRRILAEYYQYIGDDDYVNPFRKLSFEDRDPEKRPHFEPAWIRDKILAPGALDGLNLQARMIVYTMVETGARPSEIANLTPEQIVLDAPVPHISIRPRQKEHRREIKTHTSVRTIPLVGVALEALKRCPNGFPRYMDKEDTLSQTLLKAMRAAGLMPSEAHVVYSLRHSFEKRMQEGGLDYGLRTRLMGHSTDRPEYGDGGALDYQRDQLLAIALPFDDALFAC